MTIPDALRPYLRSAWIPITREEGADVRASTFSGLAWIPEGETWPVCPNCARPMQLLVQLDTATLPSLMRAQAGTGLIQAFNCTSSEPMCDVDLEGWEAFSAAHVVRRVHPEGVPALSAPPEAIVDRFPPKRIRGWVEHQEVPGWEESVVQGTDLPDAVWDEIYKSGYYRSSDKLGGWPAWVQSPERPACPACGQEMTVLFQIDSCDNLPVLLGDMGTGHVSVCPQHPDVLAFAWACG